MTSSSSQKRKALKTSPKAIHTCRKRAAMAVATLPYINKIPKHNSILTGHRWVWELLSGYLHHNMMGLSKLVFC
ncbi:hypothetical protein BDR06DRAFT_895460 [Suillus hirtellus]|nr:hypothetical protein BDR06DRAFT_895460 [Suillus hirtellus]